MNKHRKLLSLTMLVALAAFTLTGCGASSDEDTSDPAPASVSEDSSTTSDDLSAAKETNTASEDEVVIGEINSMSLDSLSLNLYESSGEITDPTAIDPAALSPLYEISSVPLTSDAKVEAVTGGALEAKTTDDLNVGDVVAIKGQAIYILGEVSMGGDRIVPYAETADASDGTTAAH